MSRNALALAAVSFFACSIADAKVTGSGTARTEARTTADFTSIEIKGSMTVDVTVGGARAIEVTADDNVVPIVRTQVKKGRLIIDTTDSYSTKRPVMVKVTVPALEGLASQGSGDTRVRGIDRDSFALALSGSGSIEADGKAASMVVAVNGSGEIHARGIASDEVSVAVSGSGDVELSVRSALSATISGSGNVDYWGKPQVSRVISGSGSLRKH